MDALKTITESDAENISEAIFHADVNEYDVVISHLINNEEYEITFQDIIPDDYNVVENLKYSYLLPEFRVETLDDLTHEEYWNELSLDEKFDSIINHLKENTTKVFIKQL